MPVSAGRPTIHDIARVAGVTRSVVSRALTGTGSVSPQARERILAAAAELGYQPNRAARTLVTGRSKIIGALARKVTDPSYGYIIAGLQDRATRYNYRVLTITGNLDTALEREGLQTLVSLQVDGLVVGSGRLSNTSIVEFAQQVPTVVLGRDVPGVDAVDHDETHTTAELLGHLWDLGHRIIGFLAVPTQYNRGAVTKTKSLRKVAGHLGMTLVVENASNEFAPSRGATVRLLAAHPEITAVVGLTSFAGLGAISALEAAGLQVPQDMSVVCFNDPLLGDIQQLGLTGVLQSQEQLGHQAVDLIIERLADPSRPVQRRLVTGTFKVGATSSRARDDGATSRTRSRRSSS